MANSDYAACIELAFPDEYVADFCTDESSGAWIVRLTGDRYLRGYYGSCSGCDDFIDRFGLEPAREGMVQYGRELIADGTLTASDVRAELSAEDYDDNRRIREWLDAQVAE